MNRVVVSVCILFDCLPISSSSDDIWPPALFLLPVMECSSFSSISERNLWRRPEIELTLEMGWAGSEWRNCSIICKKYMERETRQAIPHIRKRPQKLLNRSRSESISASSKLQAFCMSHLSWIRCSSPFSESCRIAVDKSTAKGESRGNAYQYHVVTPISQMLHHIKHQIH